MKHLILSLSAIAFLANCTNSKRVTQAPSVNQSNERTEIIPDTKSSRLAQNKIPDKTENNPYLDSTTIIGSPVAWVDKIITVIPDDIGWGVYPPPGSWGYPFEIDWGTFTSTYILLPDTLEENIDIPKNHFTSGKNCYSIIPNEEGAIFNMEVLEEETVNVALKQFGDCSSHLPLNISWSNTPLKMKIGSGSIQLNYPKHYSLDLEITFDGTLGRQSIQIQS